LHWQQPRSIFAEYLIRCLGKGKFESFSAGANPRPAVNPYTVRVLRESYEMDPSDVYPKSWDEYKDTVFDFVITPCDNAKEHWPGQPIIAHWPSADPAHFKGIDGDLASQPFRGGLMRSVTGRRSSQCLAAFPHKTA
jgi:arsenate reductase (thioredoxin)